MAALLPVDKERISAMLAEFSDAPVPYGHLNIELGEQSADTMKKAELELRETPQRVEETIRELRQMVLADKTFSCRTDDEFLKVFLRPCKFYVDSAFERIQTFHKHLEKHFKVYTSISMEKVAAVILDIIVVGLPYRDLDGRRIFYLKCGAWDTKKYTFDEVYACACALIAIGIQEPKSQIHGAVAIVDIEGIYLKQLLHLTPAKLLRGVEAFSCLPARLKAIHVVNDSRLFNAGYSLIKPFIEQKYRNRIFLHGSNYKSLYKHIPQELLPVDVEGTLETRDTRRLVEVVSEHWYLYQDILKAIATKNGSTAAETNS